MIISRTPLRISFAGGGSDLPSFYEQEPGAVVSTAIDRYIYINVNRKFDHQIRASYSMTEIVESLDELKHELIREALRLVGVRSAVEITSISDVPSKGTGLGSSSTYTVGLLNALYAYIGRHADASRLAKGACKIEIDICNSPIGKQDQYIAAYGGFQFIQFNPDGTVFVDPIVCKPETKQKLQSRLIAFYTGITRSTNVILDEQNKNIKKSESTRKTLSRMVGMAHQLRASLQDNDLDAFGEILHESWMLKRQVANTISNSQIDAWYETARRHGAIGGKVLGAGGGGFLLLYAPEEKHDYIATALSDLKRVQFGFEPQGSKIIYVEEKPERLK
jgi:D-glycero-alpha-D-manno-heptose-7-phosphate kinase